MIKEIKTHNSYQDGL